MAVRYAVANGNWSNTATWNGGTLPTAADDIYANGFTVTIDGPFTVLSIRNTTLASPAIVAGGQFIYANGGNLTCTASQAIYVGTTNTLEMTLASPNTAIFNGNVLTIAGAFGANAIRLSNTGTLSLNGNYQMINHASDYRIIDVVAAGTLNIVGNLTSLNADGTQIGYNASALRTSAGATVNITGNVTGSLAPSFAIKSTIYSSVASTINITGNVIGSTGQAITLVGGGNLNVIGNVTSSNQVAITNSTIAATISVTGIITASAFSPAIYSSFALASGYASGTYVKVSGNVINSTNNMAIVAPRVTIDSNTSSWLFQTSTGGTRTLYAAGVNLGNPLESNVRLGTVYGTSNELTGTMNVPPSSVVLKSVPVDNTTGTLLMTPSDVWNYLISSGFTSSSIGDRLQNTSTVSTTGGQIASYNI